MNEAFYNINFHQLEIFFATVEVESFTKAAARLHMTQSAVSKSIAKLEQELQLQLFTRHYRELHVTQAGLELYDSWKAQIRTMEKAYEKIWKLQHEEDSCLKVGATSTTDLGTYFWPVMTQFIQKFPECAVEPDSDNMERLITKLADRQLDIVFVPDFMKYRLEDLGFPWKWAAKDAIQILMSEHHPLAKKERLTLEDVKDETFVLLDEGSCPENIRFVSGLFASAGYEIKLSNRKYRTPEGIESFYQPSDGVMIGDSFFKYENNRQKMIRKPLEGYQNGIICGWRDDNDSQYLKQLLNLVPLKELPGHV